MLDKVLGLVGVNLHSKMLIGGVIGIGCSLKAICSLTCGSVIVSILLTRSKARLKIPPSIWHVRLMVGISGGI